MTTGILFCVCLMIICIIGLVQDFSREKKGAGWFTFIGCIIGVWLSLAGLLEVCNKINTVKPEVPTEKTIIKQDTIPINIKIIVEHE